VLEVGWRAKMTDDTDDSPQRKPGKSWGEVHPDCEYCKNRKAYQRQVVQSQRDALRKQGLTARGTIRRKAARQK